MEAKIVLAKDIHVDERVRENFGDLQELADSLNTYMGQIQSLAVMLRAKDDDRTILPYILLAGGRRLEASRLAGMQEVLVRIYPATLTIDEQKEIELVENTSRLDLAWPERLKLTNEIHVLRQKTAEKAGETWTVGDTAKILGVKSAWRTSDDITLAKIVEANPVLKECQTKHEATKVVQKMLASIDTKKKASAFEEKIKETADGEEASSIDDTIRRTLIGGYKIIDALEGLKQLADCSQDFIVLDPPYESGFEDKGTAGTNRTEVEVQMDKMDFVRIKDYGAFMHDVIAECYRVLKPDSWIILWHGTSMYQINYDLLVGAGFTTRNVPAIWNKTQNEGGSKYASAIDYHLGTCYEPFFYARKGLAKIKRVNRADVFNYSRPGNNKIHPTEKPVELTLDIISTFVRPNSQILIPFLGSGNDLLAACAFRCRAFGFELGAAYRDSFIQRVSTIKANELFLKGEKYVNPM